MDHKIYDVAVIGTGFSGLGIAVSLKRQGVHDFVVLERGADVGGTWRDNHYPGAACDIQSHLYSYSFRMNPHWSRVYAGQPEILAYLQDTARAEGLLPHIRFHAEVTAAVWDESRHLWQVDTLAGPVTARALVAAAGHLSDPTWPDIEGLDSFEGRLMHSAAWDHDWSPAGQRVAVIGTGASAIQLVPELAKTAGELTVLQRSAPYVVPRRDHPYSPAEQGMFARLPQTMRDLRAELFWANEGRFPQRRQFPDFIKIPHEAALAHLSAQVADPALRAKLTPDYAIGCKRILISNEYYPALKQDNVTLETTPVAKITQTGIVLRDGSEIACDALVCATGFAATDLPIAYRIAGEGGQKLSDVWQDGGHAFHCTAVAGFPNLFVMLGPNTGLGAGSMVFVVETQIAYITGALDHVLTQGQALAPDPDAQVAYVDSIQSRAEGSVWTAGHCQSWYLHPKTGRLTTLWPDFMTQFREENGTFSPEGYIAAVGAPS